MDRKRVIQWTIILLMLCACKLPFKASNPPNAPTVSGPNSAQVNESVTFTASATDPDNDDVAIRFSWGDGNTSSWSPYVSSGQSVSMSHTYTSAGTYYVKAQAKDENGATSDWSTAHEVIITVANNPPNAPTVSGPDSAQVNESVTFTASATDPDNDDVAIRFSWGDGNTSNWSSYVSSGQSVSMSHTYTTAGTYYVKAQAKDENGATSDWSSAFTINVEHAWVKTDLGECDDEMWEVTVGDGRGDGKPRVYAAGFLPVIYEFEWTGSSWVLKTGFGPTDWASIFGIAVGDGRGDGKPRVYAACEDCHVYEFEWIGGSWVKTDLGSGGELMGGVAVGDGRGDGKPRVYAACADNHVYEFEWIGSGWVKTDLGSGGNWMEGVAVGDGRGDGKPRVYAACADWHIYEFEWK